MFCFVWMFVLMFICLFVENFIPISKLQGGCFPFLGKSFDRHKLHGGYYEYQCETNKEGINVYHNLYKFHCISWKLKYHKSSSFSFSKGWKSSEFSNARSKCRLTNISEIIIICGIVTKIRRLRLIRRSMIFPTYDFETVYVLYFIHLNDSKCCNRVLLTYRKRKWVSPLPHPHHTRVVSQSTIGISSHLPHWRSSDDTSIG